MRNFEAIPNVFFLGGAPVGIQQSFAAMPKSCPAGSAMFPATSVDHEGMGGKVACITPQPRLCTNGGMPYLYWLVGSRFYPATTETECDDDTTDYPYRPRAVGIWLGCARICRLCATLTSIFLVSE
jgi:hypothetical protein